MNSTVSGGGEGGMHQASGQIPMLGQVYPKGLQPTENPQCSRGKVGGERAVFCTDCNLHSPFPGPM